MDPTVLDAWRTLADHWDLAPDPSRAGRWAGASEGARLELEVGPDAEGAGLDVGLAVDTGRATLMLMPAAHALRLAGRRASGDPTFDAAVLLVDARWEIHALLDLETRALVADLVVRRGLTAAGGRLVLDARATSRLTAGEVVATATAIAELGRRVAALDHPSAIAALLRIALEDPAPGVRSALVRLGAELPDLRDGLARAAVGSEHADDATFERLQRLVTNAALGVGPRSAALRRLVEMFPFARCEGLVADTHADLGDALLPTLIALAERREVDAAPLARRLAPFVASGDAAADGALVALMRLDVPGAEMLKLLGPAGRTYALAEVPRLAAPGVGLRGDLPAALYPGTEPHPTLGPAYLRALGVIGDPRQAPLVEQALRSPYSGLPEAAVEALAHLGTLAQVPALAPLTSGVFRSARLKESARAAIEAIRARHGAFDAPGALTLAGGDRQGGLALAAGSDDARASGEPPPPAKRR